MYGMCDAILEIVSKNVILARKAVEFSSTQIDCHSNALSLNNWKMLNDWWCYENKHLIVIINGISSVLVPFVQIVIL